MKEIIELLENELKCKEEMIGTTAPTHWLDVGLSQELWDIKEEKKCENLRKAIKLLKGDNMKTPRAMRDVDECFEKIEDLLEEYNCAFGHDMDGMYIFDWDSKEFTRIKDETEE